MSKTNLAKKLGSLAYRIVEDERYGVARVAWDGASSLTANDLVRPRVDEDEAPALAEAARVLKEILADGPLAAGNIKRMAASAGVAERTLHRARQALGVTTRRQGFGQGAFYVWAMPADPPEPMAQGTHGMDAMDATCQGAIEHDAHGQPTYDPEDPRRFTR
jgi:hypothetical protein